MDLRTYKHQGIAGICLAEVLSVIITPHAKEYKLHGTIKVDDCEGTVCIFNVGPENSQTISSSNQSLPLANRDRAILALSQFTVSFDLKDKNGDAEFIRESFSWSGSHYNMLLVENMKGKLGSVTVYYTVHWAAIETNIWAKFDIEESNVYGKFVARYKNWYDDKDNDLAEHCQFTIFEGRLTNAKDGVIFPLNRAVLTLPISTDLVIGAYLGSSEVNLVLWGDEVEFSRDELIGESIDKDIQGTCGVIRVSILAFNYVANVLAEVKRIKNAKRKVGLFPEWLGEPEQEEEEEEEDDDEDEDEPTHPKKLKESHDR